MNRIYYCIFILFWFKLAHAKSNPAWSAKAIWYQIFPERFCNGDTTNDPTQEALLGAYPEQEHLPWKIHPWTSDWYEMQSWELKNQQSIWFNIQRRRYGGDLEGIIQKLDYLKNLGINAIYLNPIFYAPSSHKYDAICYHHVDPYFGPDPKKDIITMSEETPDDPKTWQWTEADKLALKLIAEVHKRGMKIIFDGVWNHMGIENFFMKDIVKNRQKSAYASWFNITDWNSMGEMGMPFKYGAWFGVKELPEIREDENGIVIGPKEYIQNCTRRWMAPTGAVADGIDGWRLDVAYCINKKYWKEWNDFVHKLNSEAYTTAEIVDGPLEVKKYLNAGFDAVMNYNFGYAAHDFFINKNLASTGTQLDKKNREMIEVFGAKMYFMQNLFDSHDAQRLSSAAANPDLGHFSDWGSFFGKSQVERNARYNTAKPSAAHVKDMKLMIAYQMCMPGAPMFLYGDEAGMWGANDPDCRKPMVWPDLSYDSERFLPNGKPLKNDEVKFDSSIYNFYHQWINLRSQNPALSLGKYRMMLTIDSAQVFIFERRWKQSTYYVMINKGDNDFIYKYLLGGKDQFSFASNTMMLAGNLDQRFQKASTQYTLKAKSIVLLKKI